MENRIQSILEYTRGWGKKSRKLNGHRRLQGGAKPQSILKAGINRKSEKERASQGSHSDNTGQDVMGPGVC